MNSERNRLEVARDAFEALKRQCEVSGGKLTISAVAREAKIDRKYFYGKINTPDESKRKAWLTLGVEINEYRARQKVIVEASNEIPIGAKLENALIENYKLLETVGQLEGIRAKMQELLAVKQKQIDELENHASRLESDLIHARSDKRSVVPFGAKPHIISPDALRSGADALALKKAWVQALDKLRSELNRPTEKTLYVMIGAPGSGKSTWSMNQYFSQNYSIIFDACCLTKSDRYDVLSVGRLYPNTKIVGVVVCADFLTLKKRNNNRETAKRVPLSKLSVMYESLEMPSMEDSDEIFDEIVLVRGDVVNVH